jgi:hypothetical protein
MADQGDAQRRAYELKSVLMIRTGRPGFKVHPYIGVLKDAGGRHKNPFPLGYYGASDYHSSWFSLSPAPS